MGALGKSGIMRHPRRGENAFTLVELLIVVAVIAVLMLRPQGLFGEKE